MNSENIIYIFVTFFGKAKAFLILKVGSCVFSITLSKPLCNIVVEKNFNFSFYFYLIFEKQNPRNGQKYIFQ